MHHHLTYLRMAHWYSRSCWALILMLTLLCCSCESTRYYGQLVSGQISILSNRQPIDRMLSDPQTPQKLKSQLTDLLEVREFASQHLHLPVEDHYLTFVDLDRPYVLWNVYAAPEFALTPKTWRYPIIGQAAYRGYFSIDDARRKAKHLEQRQFDVYIGGVTAYSTLGWFDDAVLSTILYRDRIGIAALIFHELAHQLVFVKGDTAFNESFATSVEQEGLRRWLQKKDQAHIYEQYLQARLRQREFIGLITGYRKRLSGLYRTELPDPIKRYRKSLLFDQMRTDYHQLKQGWNHYAGYDQWFGPPLNNAKLASVAVYHDFVPAFKELLHRHDNKLKPFYAACHELAELPKTDRHQKLIELSQSKTAYPEEKTHIHFND